MGPQARHIRSIAVFGGGIVGISAAAAFARALPKTGVTLVETPVEPGAVADRIPVGAPTVATFHAMIGVDEAELVNAGIATHHLGTKFEGWSGDGEPWWHAYGDYGRPIAQTRFDQIWVAAAQRAKVASYDQYSAGAVLAAAHKFLHPSPDSRSPLAHFLYGLRFEPELYRAQLCSGLVGRVEMLRGEIAGTERRDNGALKSVALGGGESVEADLFIDCTGPSAKLLCAVEDDFEDWGGLFPCDRLWSATADAAAVPAPASSATAIDAGWIGEWPLRASMLRVFLFNSAASDEAAAAGLGTTPQQVADLRAGRRLRPWVRNVLALGDAAVAVDPLHGMNLELAHRGILLALELIPGRDCHPLELREYNRRFDLIAAQVRDFLAAHYVCAGRTEGDFWSKPAVSRIPDTLAMIIDQYRSRCWLPFQEEEIITRDSWAAALLGLGVVPQAADPVAAGLSFDTVLPAMERLAKQLQSLAADAPAYSEYLRAMARRSGRRAPPTPSSPAA